MQGDDDIEKAATDRIAVEQAKGIVAETFALEVDKALHPLQRYSDDAGLTIEDVARSMINDPAEAHRLSDYLG